MSFKLISAVKTLSKIQVRRLLFPCILYCIPAAVVLVSEEEPLAGLGGEGASVAAVGEFPSFSSSELLDVIFFSFVGFFIRMPNSHHTFLIRLPPCRLQPRPRSRLSASSAADSVSSSLPPSY